MVREFRLARFLVHSLTIGVYTLKLIVGNKVIQTNALREGWFLRIDVSRTLSSKMF